MQETMHNKNHMRNIFVTNTFLLYFFNKKLICTDVYRSCVYTLKRKNKYI